MPTNIERLEQHPTIKKLSDLPIWTVNNINPSLGNSKDPLKIPLDAKVLIEQGKTKFLTDKVNYNPYVTLPALCQLDERFNSRVVAASLKKTGYLFVDVERDLLEDNLSSEEQIMYNHVVEDCLADYAEFSTHKGVHMLIKIPDILLNDPNYQMVFQANNIKWPNHTLEVFAGGGHKFTFTGDIIETPEMEHDSDEFINHIKRFLDFCLDELGNSMTARSSGQAGRIDDEGLSEFQENFLKYAYKKIDIGRILNKADKNAENGKDNGDYDTSKAEWTVISSALYYIDQLYQKIKASPIRLGIIPGFKDDLNAEEFCLLAYHFSKQIMSDDGRERSKWYSKRDGMPYLLYLTTNAYSQYHESYEYGDLIATTDEV